MAVIRREAKCKIGISFYFNLFLIVHCIELCIFLFLNRRGSELGFHKVLLLDDWGHVLKQRVGARLYLGGRATAEKRIHHKRRRLNVRGNQLVRIEVHRGRRKPLLVIFIRIIEIQEQRQWRLRKMQVQLGALLLILIGLEPLKSLSKNYRITKEYNPPFYDSEA